MRFMYFLQFGDLHGFKSIKLFGFFVSDFEYLAIGSLIQFGLCIVFFIIQYLVDECDLVLHYTGCRLCLINNN